MGFFNTLELPSARTRPLHAFLPASISWLFAASKPAQHDVSFDLTTSSSAFEVSILPPPRVSKPAALPLEVVLSIIEAAYFTDDLEVNEDLLRSCSLVCRSWSMVSQKLLFSQVTLRTQRAFELFSTAVDRSTERGCALGDSVIRLRVVLDHNQPFTLHQHSFALAVMMCPNLYELNLALYGCAAPGEDIVGVPAISRMRRPAPSFDDHTLALLKAGPTITALQFSNWSENDQSIFQLLDVWPSLKSLIISGTPPQLPSPSSAPFSCELDELRMNFQTPPSVDFMKWLLHNSTSLRVLEFEREPSAHLLEYLVDTHGASLHSLSIPAVTADACLALHKCKQLREVAIQSCTTSPAVYKKLPEVLEHVAVGVDSDTQLIPLIYLVKSKNALKAVTVHLRDGATAHKELAVLKVACAYRGVELRMVRDVQVFRKLVRGDPISVEAYPRPKSLDNLHIMRS
ncbi:hypothetical protein BDQ12DRAFT_599111 [Crucibulum laeve]|uniref:Uncharacterized protein n=1 Tax=Crucibulum laeve TaxID=68775 RepID=A0A5C3MBP2_9AGAR|nr:hypothetical protein BDQ12DRAFT_599111 [Crucibulum laeve]